MSAGGASSDLTPPTRVDMIHLSGSRKGLRISFAIDKAIEP